MNVVDNGLPPIVPLMIVIFSILFGCGFEGVSFAPFGSCVTYTEGYCTSRSLAYKEPGLRYWVYR